MAASRAFYADLAGFTSARAGSIARQRARWQLRGDRYLRKYGGMKPKQALITVDPSHSLIVLDLIERIAPSLARAYERHMGDIAQAAFRDWPVRSGLSKSLLTLEYTTTGGGTRFVGRLRNRAPYAWFIRYTGSGRYGEVVEDLVFAPGLRAAGRILADAGDGVVR